LPENSGGRPEAQGLERIKEADFFFAEFVFDFIVEGPRC